MLSCAVGLILTEQKPKIKGPVSNLSVLKYNLVEPVRTDPCRSRGGKHLRRARGIAAVLIVTLALLVFTGCGGGEEEKAREYIDSAREEARSVAQKQLEIQRRGEELNEFLEEVNAITPDAVAATEELLRKLTELAEVTSEAAAGARAEYEKVLELEGVEDHKEYAENRIDALELVERRSELAVEFASIYSRALATGLETGQIDEAAVRGLVEPLVEERDAINNEITELNEQAADLQEELDL